MACDYFFFLMVFDNNLMQIRSDICQINLQNPNDPSSFILHKVKLYCFLLNSTQSLKFEPSPSSSKKNLDIRDCGKIFTGIPCLWSLLPSKLSVHTVYPSKISMIRLSVFFNLVLSLDYVILIRFLCLRFAIHLMTFF